MNENGSIELTVLFFGATSDVVAARSMPLQVPQGASAADALRRVLDAHPSLASHKLLYSLNQVYARGDERVKAGDELAVFTAVSGG